MDKHRDRKTKTHSQKIGTQNERIFAEWCGDRHLTANKVEEDYGIDFFCEIMEEVSLRSEQTTGSVLAAQVRTVSGHSRPRVKLDRKDANNLLQQQHPACLIGVNNDSRQVYFRFVDKLFSEELHQFLASPTESHSIPLSKMSSDVDAFDTLLQEKRRPVNQYTRTIQEVKRKLTSVVPDLELNIRNTDSGSMALVHVPWIGSVFVATENKEAVRAAVFERGKEGYRLPGISLKPEFAHISKIADGAFLIGLGEGQKTIEVRHKGRSEKLSFAVRHLDDEFAFTHDAGITLMHSKARKRGDEWVHELGVRLFSAGSLDKFPAAIPFLRLLRPGAQLTLNRKKWITVDKWPSLPFLGLAVDGLCHLCESSAIKLSDFRLVDFKDEELGRSLVFFNVLLGREAALSDFFPGYVLNQAIDSLEGLKTEDAEFAIPIAQNVKQHGVIVTVHASGVAYTGDAGGLTGIRIKKVRDCKVEIRTRLNKSVFPEVWIDKRMPPVKIGADDGGEIQFRPTVDENILAVTKVIFSGDEDNTIEKAPIGLGVGNNGYSVASCMPKDLSEADITRCSAIIAAGGAVDPESAARELPRATVLVVVQKNDEIVGVGTIKRVRPGYARGISGESGHSFDPNIPELGYVAVEDDHRDQGLSNEIVAKLLSQHTGPLFATTDNERMKRTLEAAGFSRKGHSWMGNRGELSLWISEGSSNLGRSDSEA